MRKWRDMLIGAGAVVVAVVVCGWTSLAWAQGCATCTTTSLRLPLAGSIFLPGDPCLPAGENVALSGEVHVVTKVRPNFTTDIHLNTAGVDGPGQSSGSLYIGTGSTKFINVQLPSDPCFPIPLQANVTLEPTNGCASVPLPLALTLCFSSDGTLLPESTVVIGGVD